jgi:V8-like Glu-specific endopeptidase
VAQVVALSAEGFRLTRPFRLDGDRLPGPMPWLPLGLPTDLVGALDAPGDPDPAAVGQSLATGSRVYGIDARRAPVPPPREAGRSGARTSAGSDDGGDMSGLSLVDLEHMTSFPQSAAVKIFVQFEGDEAGYYVPGIGHRAGIFSVGSGILIDPEHVLTAAHVVYDPDRGGRAVKVWVIPGYSATAAEADVPWDTDMATWGGTAPYGHAEVERMQTWSDWRSDRDFKHDVAVLQLDRPVGALAGWIGVAYELDCDFYKDHTFYLRGYPADDPYNGSRMYQASGSFDSCPTQWEARYNQESFDGQSGSGCYRVDGSGDRWVHGVISHIPGVWPNRTDVVRLRDEKYDDIRDWMNDHRGTVADLTPLAMRFDDAVYSPAPTTVVRGHSYDVEFTCLNYARVSRSGELRYKIYLSNDDTIDSSDTLLASITKSSVPVGALDTIDLHDTITIPSGVLFTHCYLGVVLTTADARSGNQTTTVQDVLRVGVSYP